MSTSVSTFSSGASFLLLSVFTASLISAKKPALPALLPSVLVLVFAVLVGCALCFCSLLGWGSTVLVGCALVLCLLLGWFCVLVWEVLASTALVLRSLLGWFCVLGEIFFGVSHPIVSDKARSTNEAVRCLSCIGQSAWCTNNIDKQLVKTKAQRGGESCCVVGAGDCVVALA